MIFYLGLMLKRLEYKVMAAHSAEEALRAMEQTIPSIVLTDTTLPGMSGTELLKRIKRSPKMQSVPVVFLTSQSDTGLQAECEHLGCAGFLCKPVEPDVLYRRLQAVSEFVPRANIRLAASLKVVLTNAHAGGAERTETVTEISEGGIFVKTTEPGRRNDTLRVRIFLPQGEILATAVVLYRAAAAAGSHDVPGMGMKFAEISDADRRRIAQYIKERLVGDIAPAL